MNKQFRTLNVGVKIADEESKFPCHDHVALACGDLDRACALKNCTHDDHQ